MRKQQQKYENDDEVPHTHHHHHHHHRHRRRPRERRWSSASQVVTDAALHATTGGRPRQPGHNGFGFGDRSGSGGLFALSDAGADGQRARCRSSITTLGIGTRGTPKEHPAAALMEMIAPPAPPLPRDEGWTLRGKAWEEDTGASNGIPRATASTAASSGAGNGEKRWGRRRTGVGPAAEDRQVVNDDDDYNHDQDDEFDESSVMATLRAAGSSVLSLTISERKALFEVALIEHVDALTRRLFDPDMDGVTPRVSVDVALQ